MRKAMWFVVASLVATAAALGAVTAATGGADPTHPIREDQTEGFGNEDSREFPTSGHTH